MPEALDGLTRVSECVRGVGRRPRRAAHHLLGALGGDGDAAERGARQVRARDREAASLDVRSKGTHPMGLEQVRQLREGSHGAERIHPRWWHGRGLLGRG